MGKQSLASSPGLGEATPLQGKPRLHPHPSFELWGDFTQRRDSLLILLNPLPGNPGLSRDRSEPEAPSEDGVKAAMSRSPGVVYFAFLQ